MDDRVTAVSRLDAIVLERQRACLKWKDSMLRKVTQTMRNCGVPAKFAEAAESSLSAGLRQRTGCVLNAQGLYIFGSPGVGKTHVAAVCVKIYILNMEPVFRHELSTVPQEVDYPVFSTVAELLLYVRDSFVQRDLSENDVLKRYWAAPLLVLDDLGGEKISEWSAKTLYTIINRRYVQRLPVVITSAMNLKEFQDRYNAASAAVGSAIARRITETSKILSLHAAQKTTAPGRNKEEDR